MIHLKPEPGQLPDINWPVLLKIPVIMGKVDTPVYKEKFRLSDREIYDLIWTDFQVPFDHLKASQMIIDIISKKKKEKFIEFVQKVAQEYRDKLISLGADLDFNFLDLTLDADKEYQEKLQSVGLGNMVGQLYQIVEIDWTLRDMSGNSIVYYEFYTKRDIRIKNTEEKCLCSKRNLRLSS